VYRSVLLMLGMGICAAAQGSEDDLIRGQWRMAGHDLGNTRSQPAELLIGPANVHSLTVKWAFTTGGDISATPTVFGDAVYFPDWAGNLYAVNKHTGQLIWSHKISDYDGFAAAISRTSPAIHGNDVIVGDIETRVALHNGANIIAADRTTGALRWITRVDTHVSAEITGSPVVFGDIVYVGVSSLEEGFALAGAAYPCCTFRGSVVALDANSGRLLWKTYTVPDNGGVPAYTLVPSGQKITWGAWSALDVFTGRLIWQTADPTAGAIDTGSVSVANGVMYAGSQSGSMYALDASTGRILWSFASGGSVVDGPSIVDGVLYWGSGYSNPGTGNNKLYAFSIKGRR
jgi:outer membrane protein assembly factor BamB